MSAPAADATALITAATARLRAAGIDTPGTDARLLAAHALGLTHKELALGLLRGISLDPGQQRTFAAALELARQGAVELRQDAVFAPISLRAGSAGRPRLVVV